MPELATWELRDLGSIPSASKPVSHPEKGTEYATPEFWHKILEDATPQFYSSEECLEMGLIDKVE